MKLRTGLLEHLTDRGILEEAVATVHCFASEPLLSRTGTGRLSFSSTDERAQRSGKPSAVKSSAPGETLDFLKHCQRLAPFLLFYGRIFATIGRELGRALFGDLSSARNREVASVNAPSIAG
jgi:hypothetical protein